MIFFDEKIIQYSMKIFTIKKSVLCIALAIFCLVCIMVGVCCASKMASSPKAQYTIVIDAGHGGVDGGASGKKTGVTESELNLKYAYALKNICEDFGLKVILTRSDMDGLYDENASSKKKSEMEKRKQIIEKARPNFVVSIHMNSFPGAEVRGAHVFYGENSQSGKALAESVANELFQNIPYAHKTVKVGDYFILNNINFPSILVECGFLSNEEEEKLLQNEDYINKFCYQIFCGLLKNL